MLDYGRKKTWLGLVFSFRGSALERVRYRLLAVGLVSLVPTLLHELGPHHPSLSLPALSLMGLALGIFLGFRNNTSYDRFWEGRKLWGSLVNTCRTLSRELVTVLPADVHRRQVYRLLAFVHALRRKLRDQEDLEALGPYLSEEDRAHVARHQSRCNAILLLLAREHQELERSGQLSELWAVQLATRLEQLSDVQGGCERIKNTPIPHSYSILIHGIVAMYVFALPFGLVEELHLLTPVVVLMVAYTFLGLDAVGDELEDPFGEDLNDLPLATISAGIEVNLRQVLGESDVPLPAVPVNGHYL